MPETRYSTGRENPGLRNSTWARKREGLQDIQEIARAPEWVEPMRTRDDIGETRVVEKVEPLNASPNPPLVMPDHPPMDLSPGSLNYLVPPQPIAEVATCLLCQRAEAECAVLVELHSGHICDQCTEEAIDLVKQELPKRRLRLAMERMLAGEVTPEMVERIERLAQPVPDCEGE